ncbi:MAG: hypothetical protein H6826_09860 [Planctomycetes bacterium]|nr:hypothetical protein [Planctomycetota bacterium]
MKGVSGELIVFLLTFVVWVVGQIVERKRKQQQEAERHPDAQHGPRRGRQREPWLPPADDRVIVDTFGADETPVESVPEMTVASWAPASVGTDTGMGRVRASEAEVRSAAARHRLQLAGAPGEGREALRRAVVLSEVLGPPRALRAWQPPQ